jgi:hypothetical protein
MFHYIGLHRVFLFAAMLCVGLAPAWGAAQYKGVTLYVNAAATGANTGTSWTDAFTDLQSALDGAVDGDQIWVAAGTYTPSKTIGGATDPRRAAFVLKSGVQVYGGFAGSEKQLQKRRLDPSVTVLSGDIGTSGSDGDNCYHVVYASGVTGAVLDGFTVTGGRGDGGTSYTNYHGAGMHTTNSVLTVANCAFIDNKVGVTTRNYNLVHGGGMANFNSALVVTNCTFTANQAGNRANSTIGTGGGMYNEGFYSTTGDPQESVITGCTFSNNLASSMNNPQNGGGGGGGLANVQCSPTVDRCTFTENMAGCGGGILNYLADRPTITNCTFVGNTTIGDGIGGAIYNFARANIINCTFYKNGWRPSFFPPYDLRPYTYLGGAIYDERVGSTITNCLFSDNAVRGIGGAIYSHVIHPSPYARTTLINCLFYNNIGRDMFGENWVTSHVYGSQLSPDSVSNLFDIDPLLKDPAGGDFHLRYDSPCIDAGTTQKFLQIRWMPVPAKDYEGDQRFVDANGDDVPAADIGVDEFIPDLADLWAFLEALADRGELDAATAASLLTYVDDAQAALDNDAKATAISILNALIADAEATLGNTDTALRIVRMTEVVIEHLD